MPQPLVSIIIPCYNAEEHIERAIHSALAQSYPYCEVIVINDGSTDSSMDIINSFGDRIKKESTENQGGCAARNRGIELSTGDFIQFLDADDELCSEKISLQLPIVQAGTADIVFCDWKEIGEDGSISHRHANAESKDDPVIITLEKGIGTHAPLHLKENLLKVGGFRTGLPCSQERDLHLRMACHNMTFQRFEKELVIVHRYENSVSASYKRVLIQHEEIITNTLHILETNNSMNQQRAKAFAEFLVRDGRLLLRMAEKEQAHKYFATAKDLHSKAGMGAYSTAARILCKILGHDRCEELVCRYRSLKARKI